MDRLLAHCGHSSGQERFMDSNVMEKERGITISSKYTSLQYGKYTLNAVDTPGHADFGGEVERILGMVDGAVLLVDANEGPLQQTKFVVEKALKAGIRPLVVLNKVDRSGATEQRCGEVESNIFDLFAQMGATEEQLDFQVLYASAREGWASTSLPEQGIKPEGASVAPLLDAIVKHVPPPAGDLGAPFAMLVAMVEHDAFLGPIATGRVAAGTARVGDRVRVLHHTGNPGEEGRLTKIWKRSGLGRLELEAAGAGDIVSVTGAGTARIADTVGSLDLEEALAPGIIEPPTLSMVFSPNDSPLAGREGTHLTGSKIGERLAAEAATSVSLRVVPVDGGGEAFEVQARGELQLGLLIENMRREGFELSVSPPRVVYREEGGHKLEPLEEVICEIEEEQAGSVIEALSLRKAELVEMVPQAGGKQRLVFEAPSRGLIGFRSAFATLTRGTGILHRAFARYGRFKGALDGVRKGVLISTADGKTTLHALGSLEARGSLFAGVGTEVYAGMIIGECARDNNMEVNPVREKKLTNVRASGADEKTYLTPPRAMTLEDAIGYVAGDELMEVTPKSIRLRKRMLDSSQRKSLKRKTG
ncbi:GTP-binding protein TypA [Coccomyxa subellipsoidea C-169]|uniref:GTP-binding protein TypA n=1 Tax=Coccomyxa subellipsoidea (strain C-169) TaxID=574566 RepID=I0Z5B7_COCSC|nr:GTP-binding protein TypA [Coccomyxa subellipsoidea C-169]EIE25836.1 GTP-binding protein TypA [Coccomyxa subellipsoidea C-169]|eukprot:XP_005650380.1 GTP-binding protein TypA [Coccomyxa subellipsoidea C-169]